MALTITMGSRLYADWDKYRIGRRSTCVHCGGKIINYPWNNDYHHEEKDKHHEAVPATEENIIDRILNKYGE